MTILTPDLFVLFQRASLTDFDRFKLMKAKQAVRMQTELLLFTPTFHISLFLSIV